MRDDEPNEPLIQEIMELLAGMDDEARDEMARLMHITREEIDRMVANWQATHN
jgi:plasmid maintenance system antidote protein VapI